MAPSLHMVEVRKAKGDTLEFHKVLSSGTRTVYLEMALLMFKALVIPLYHSCIDF